MKAIAMIFALALIGMSAHAQTIVNLGGGIAGNGIIGTTSPVYAIDMSEDGTWVVINYNHYYPVLPWDGASPFVHVQKWDAVKGKPVPHGIIKVMSMDGSQFLAGEIFIRILPRMRVLNCKIIPFYMPRPPLILPTKVTSAGQILVSKWSWVTESFVPRPDLTFYRPFVTGAVQLNSDGSFYAAIYDTFKASNMPVSQLSIVLAPSGPIPPIMPARVK